MRMIEITSCQKCPYGGNWRVCSEIRRLVRERLNVSCLRGEEIALSAARIPRAVYEKGTTWELCPFPEVP